MICNNIITKHIALIILRNGILVTIVIDFEKFLMTSEKIILRMKSKTIITCAKFYLIQEKLKNFQYFSLKTCSQRKTFDSKNLFNEMFDFLIICRSIFFTLKIC
jgi:large-conductance mechanosensitive channel